MSQDEITVMDGGKCIFQLRGVRPFYQINTILQSIRITSSLRTMTRGICLI